MLIFKTDLGKELGINFSESSNEKLLSNLTYYSYFLILFKSRAIYAIKRNRRISKRLLALRKKVKRIEKIVTEVIPEI